MTRGIEFIAPAEAENRFPIKTLKILSGRPLPQLYLPFRRLLITRSTRAPPCNIASTVADYVRMAARCFSRKNPGSGKSSTSAAVGYREPSRLKIAHFNQARSQDRIFQLLQF